MARGWRTPPSLPPRCATARWSIANGGENSAHTPGSRTTAPAPPPAAWSRERQRYHRSGGDQHRRSVCAASSAALSEQRPTGHGLSVFLANSNAEPDAKSAVGASSKSGGWTGSSSPASRWAPGMCRCWPHMQVPIVLLQQPAPQPVRTFRDDRQRTGQSGCHPALIPPDLGTPGGLHTPEEPFQRDTSPTAERYAGATGRLWKKVAWRVEPQLVAHG